MRVLLEAPGWLWLLVVCWPVVWLTTLAWPTGHGAARWGAAISRTLLLTALVVAVARPVRTTDSTAISAVALFDVSASVSQADLARERQLAHDLSRAAHPPHELRTVRFAVAPTEIADPGAPTPAKPATGIAAAPSATEIEQPSGDAALGTDIARALGLAAGLGDPTRSRRILLVSDGRATRGDALSQAARLATLGIRVDTVVLGASSGAAGDVAIDAMEAPGEIRPHATFSLLVRIAADRAARVRLTLKRDGIPVDSTIDDTVGGPTGDGDDVPEGPRQAGPGERVLTIAAGTTTVPWKVRIDKTEISVFSAEIHLTNGADAHPENDRGVLGIAVQAPPHVLLLAGAATDATPLARALTAQSIDVEVRPPARAPDAAALSRIDLVALCDVPRADLGEGAVADLDTFVHDGGGLLVTGGPHAFGPGGWDGSRLAALLPVRLDLPERRDEPALALALIIDRSGSMTGAKMDLTKRAARATAEMLPPDDQIAVIAFDSQASTIVSLQRAANRLRISTDIGRIQPTGGTNILAGLREALEQLGAARAKKKHAILLSDGQSATDGITELVDAAASSHITISTVGIGDGVDDGLLQQIAGHGGGRYYHTRDPASIPRIFTREASEVATTGIIERPTVALPRKRVAMLEGVPLERAPRLAGYVRTHARPQADLLLATDGGEPLLARWQVGLGQVVAWTSDLGPRWAETWARWPPWAKLWGQIVRATMRARAARQFPLAARVDGGIADVTVEAGGDQNSSVDSSVSLAGLDAQLEITAITADGAVGSGPPRRVPLTESAPGRYEARFPIAPDARADPGALLLRAVLTRDGRPIAHAIGHLSIPATPELRPTAAPASVEGATPTGADLLVAIASRTGGGVLRSPEDLFRGAPPRPVSRSLRTPLLVSAAALLIVDVALRRLAAAPTRRRRLGSANQAARTSAR